LLSAPAQAINIWNWSFTGSGNQSASGTFQTAEVTPTAGVIYNITGITGTYNLDSVAYEITGLSDYQGAANTFQWDGTSSSSILSNFDGISFSTSSNAVNMYSDADGYPPIDKTITNFITVEGTIVSSPLTPVPWETDALSVVGTTILFGFGVWSKRKSAKSLEK
jgi:hypothetical protein